MSNIKEFEHLKIQLEAIISATNNFADENCIGKGGFGKVYKGDIVHSKGQSMVAFKRLDRAFGQGNPEFWKEIMMLSIYRHENIVSLLGFCDESDEKILVYEYASRRSLDLYLNDDGLTWIQRLRICISAARGLAYLHNPVGMQLRVLHRDIKSSNILLDENWNAKISDFGLSKLGPANHQFSFLVSNAVGTIGYCDPLYVEMGFLTKESDVYSFGVVLFEVLCGRLCVRNNNDNYQPLTRLVRECYENNKVNEIIHGSIKDEIDPNSLKLFTRIAYQCLKREREERPLMSEIVRILETALGYQAKSWKLPDIIDSSHLKALWLPDTMAANKVMRLMYTNSGLSLLALTSNAVLKLWECHNGPNLVIDGASVFNDSGLFHPQQQHNSNKKKCAFIGCTKRAADKTAFCKAHGGGLRCEFLGCTKSAKSPTNYCIGHGGGARCINEGCTRAARGMSGLCIQHGSERNPSGKSTASIVPQLWQPTNGALMSNDVSESKPVEESASCIALSKSDFFLISASGGKVSLFNMMTRKVMTTFMPSPPAATYLAFHPQDYNIVAIGMEDSTIQIYNVMDDEVKIKLKGHQKQITGLAFSQILNALVSSGADAQLCIWNINGWEKRKSRNIQSPPGHPSSLVGETKVQFHNDQRHVLVVHESQIAIYDYQLECLRLWSPSESLSSPISSAIYSCDNLLLFTGFLDGAVGVFDAGSLRLRCRIAPFAYISSSISSNMNAYPVDIAAHPSDSNQFALGMSDGSVHVIEPAAGKKTWVVSEPQEDGPMASLNPSSCASNSEPSESSSRKRYKIAP